jgi:tetratricopeptide (TPR) repeat protein
MNRAGRRRQKRESGGRTVRASEPKTLDAIRHADMAGRGMSALEAGDAGGAEALFREVLEEDIEHPGALHGMGLIAREKGNLEVGVELLRRALLRIPDDDNLYSVLGDMLTRAERHDDAIEALSIGLRFGPRNSAILNNLGNNYMRLGLRNEALASFKKALDLGEQAQELLANYGTALSDVGQFERAKPYFDQMLSLYPEPSRFQFLYGGQMLRNGIWKEGWMYYERRFLANDFQAREQNFRAPMWDGSDLFDKRILLWGEQGIGDEIRYASMISEVLQMGADVTIECHPKLVSLFDRAFENARVVPAPYVSVPGLDCRFDFMLPFGSLGQLFRNSADEFPRREGFLAATSDRVDEFRRRLRDAGPGPYIGVCWRSGMAGTFRSDYYTVVEDLMPLLKVAGATFVNLQYDVRDEEIDLVRQRFGVEVHRWDDVDLFNDLEASAGLTAALDLVVSAATSVSCIAGALGVSTREFRPTPVAKNFLVEGFCPWFPSLKYVDKRRGESWSGVFRKIAKEVGELVAVRKEN